MVTAFYTFLLSLLELTDIFTRYELIVCMKRLEIPLEIVFNVSV